MNAQSTSAHNYLRATTRKTPQGYFQPVLVVLETGQRHSPADMNCPLLDRQTAQKYADLWRADSLAAGRITDV